MIWGIVDGLIDDAEVDFVDRTRGRAVKYAVPLLGKGIGEAAVKLRRFALIGEFGDDLRAFLLQSRDAYHICLICGRNAGARGWIIGVNELEHQTVVGSVTNIPEAVQAVVGQFL